MTERVRESAYLRVLNSSRIERERERGERELTCGF